MRKIKIPLVLAASVAAFSAFALGEHPTPGVGHNNNARYATDAYPGFDSRDEVLKPERKEPRWFAFINGPDRDNSKAQLVYCESLMNDGSYSKAAKQLDALVREWPTSPEAPKAQELYAELLLDKLDDAEEAFKAYRYLHDFYSLQCEYDRIADKLYEIAQRLEVEGKEVMFVRFENLTDVRRAYEAAVLHAPGAKWVPEALLKIAAIREKEQSYTEAVKVYENLRNLYPTSQPAKLSYLKESEDRMIMLGEWGYNLARCRDTENFLKLALKYCREEDAATIKGFYDEVLLKLEADAYTRTKFYDSPTRTKRSAISAYEKFLKAYPGSVHADEINARLEVLKGVTNDVKND